MTAEAKKKAEKEDAGDRPAAKAEGKTDIEAKVEEAIKDVMTEEELAKVRGSEEEVPKEEAPADDRRGRALDEETAEWIPKTKLGNDVLAGKYTSLAGLLEKGELILEPEIVDYLVPEMQQEIVYIGGSPGKGGGIRRTATKMTARMHKSGRRFKLTALAIVGNGEGVVGIGRAISNEHRTAIEKATKNAKLNVISLKRGCGSWECGCDSEHSIPFTTKGKSGSVEITLLPAPKGVGMVASEETKKMLKLAGIKDVWVKAKGKTSTRTNLIMAVFDALKGINRRKGDL